jgi:hypothetical protein
LWELARRELNQKVELKLGFANVQLLSQHNSLALIISAALGGEKKTQPKGFDRSEYKDLSEGHDSVESAVAAINAALRA